MRTGCRAWPLRRPGASLECVGRHHAAAGFSLLELSFVVGLMLTVGAMAVPELLGAVARYRAVGAVRHVVATLQRARAQAVASGANVGLRFTREPDRVRFVMYADGNRNGLSTRDILDGVDPAQGAADGLEQFGGVEFGVSPGVLSPDGEGDNDPIQVGLSNMVSFTPNGTSSAGSLYIRGAQDHQYVIRIYGDTGKTQILRYLRSQRRWVTL